MSEASFATRDLDSASNAGGLESGGDVGEIPNSERTPVEVLAQITKLKVEVKNFLTTHTSGRWSPGAKAATALRDASTFSIERYVPEVNTAKTSLEKAVQDLRDHIAKADTIRKEDLEQFEYVTTSSIEKVKQMTDPLVQQTEALVYLIKNGKDDKRKTYLKSRYCHKKIAKLLIAGTCANALAIRIAPRIGGAAANPDTNDFKKLELALCHKPVPEAKFN